MVSKLHNFIQKWRPLRMGLPAAELDALGVPRGPKFDKILDQIFEMQLRGRARTPEDRTKALRQLAGIKDEAKKKPEKEKKKRGEKPAGAAPAAEGGAKAEPSKPGSDAQHSKSAAAAIGAKAQAKHAAADVEKNRQKRRGRPRRRPLGVSCETLPEVQRHTGGEIADTRVVFLSLA
ncbi:MAG: hypothetical protein ABSF78_13255 [Candidatus Acidiferrales bacterium]